MHTLICCGSGFPLIGAMDEEASGDILAVRLAQV